MKSRPRLAPELREHHVPARVAAAAVIVALVYVAVAATLTLDPAPLVVLPIGLLLGLAIGLITALGRSGRQHLAAPVADEPEPDTASAPIVHLRRPADEIAVWRAKPRPARRRTYDDPMLAVAQDAGVYQPRHSCDTPTGVITAVTP